MKELEYINLAVNNVTLIEGIHGCESLQKIDLTLNFVDIEDFEESCDNLSELPDLRELFLIGNPCTDWPRWKDYVVARCPTLHRIEGTDITRSWRMKAQQDLEEMTKELTVLSRKNIEAKVLEQ